MATVELIDMVDAPFPKACRDPELAAHLAATGHTELGFDSVAGRIALVENINNPETLYARGSVEVRKEVYRAMDAGVDLIAPECAVPLATKLDEFMDAVVEHDAQILGMSALLTTTMPNMGKTINGFEEAGLRDKVTIYGRRCAYVTRVR